MSRLLAIAVCIQIFAVFPAVGQQPLNAEIAALIEKQRRMVALDEEGCAKYPVEEEIVVCGTPDDEKRQRIFKDQHDADENRLRRGEAVSTVRAVCCSPIPKLPPTVSMGFGYVPPPAIPFEEVMKGLPDQDMVVPEGSTQNAVPPVDPQ